MNEDKSSIPWTEKPPTAISASQQERKVPTLDDTAQFWKHVNLHLHQYYEKGTVIAKGNNLSDQEYGKVLDVVILCIFQCIRDNINATQLELEERQKQLKQISSIEAIFKSTIQSLNSLEIKLDSDSVICILQGCINESALQLTKKYEGRFRS